MGRIGIRGKKLLVVLVATIVIGATVVYAYYMSVQSGAKGQSSAVTHNNPTAEPPSNKSSNNPDQQTQEVDKQAPVATSANKTNTSSSVVTQQPTTQNNTPSNPTTSSPDTSNDVPKNPYAEGSSPWWVYKRRQETGQVVGNWGDTCAEWRVNAPKDGVAIIAGISIVGTTICRDVDGISSFGFVEQIGNGYTISSYNWANEPGMKTLVVPNSTGYTIIEPKTKS
jgi:hypothetical protein